MARPLLGKVITFYSYKGGTGRSFLLANIAWLLATNGRRVLVIDWDLEAPGLHRYFRPFMVDPDLTETEGLIDMVWLMASDMITRSRSDAEPSTAVSAADIDIDSYINPLRWNFIDDGCIDFIGAGRQDPTYSERVNTFDWKRFYELGGRSALQQFRERWRQEYDYVLVDSRTGVSDTSGICTIELPDAVVACLTLNRQSIEGVSSILQSIQTWEQGNLAQNTSRTSDKGRIDFFPVATRIEYAEQDKLDVARDRARAVLLPFLRRADAANVREYWDDMEVSYRPYYAYEEVLAAFGDQTGARGSARNLASEIEAIGRRITGVEKLAMQETTEQARRRVLDIYALGKAGQASKPVEPTKKLDPADDGLLEEIYAKEATWRNRDYPYRLLLSQRQLDLIQPNEVTQFGRQMTFYHRQSSQYLRTRRSCVLAAIFSYALTAIVVLALVLIRERAPDMLWSSEIKAITLFPFYILFSFWLIPAIALINAFVQSSSMPYGMRLLDLFLLGVFGPFARPITDQPDLAPSEAKSSSSGEKSQS